MCGIHKYVARRPHVKHLVVFFTRMLCCNAFAGFMSCHLQLNGITDRIVSFTFSAEQAPNNQTSAQVIPSYTKYINAPLKQHPIYADSHTRLFMHRHTHPHARIQLPCPTLRCLALSCHVLSCRVLSCPVLSCPVLACPVASCLGSANILAP